MLEVNRNTGGASHADTVTPGLAIKRCKATQDAVDVVDVVARVLYAVFLDVLLDISVDFMKLTTAGGQNERGRPVSMKNAGKVKRASGQAMECINQEEEARKANGRGGRAVRRRGNERCDEYKRRKV